MEVGWVEDTDTAISHYSGVRIAQRFNVAGGRGRTIDIAELGPFPFETFSQVEFSVSELRCWQEALKNEGKHIRDESIY